MNRASTPQAPATQTLRLPGGWRSASDGAHVEVVNPFNGATVGSVAWASAADAQVLLDELGAHVPVLTHFERSEVLRRAAAAIRDSQDELAQLICAETGLALRDCRAEVTRAHRYLDGCAAEAIRISGEVVETDILEGAEQRLAVSVARPRGLVYAVTPFNRPLHQVVVKVGPAIAAGCPIIVKPSEKTPLSAVAFMRLLDDCGLPDGLVSLITGPADVISETILGSGRVRVLAFTGSSAVGEQLAHSLGAGRALLELGDSSALVILPDADLQLAVASAVAGAYRTSGQSCRGVKRLLVHHDVADELVARLAAATEQLIVGDPQDPATDIGTLIDESRAITVQHSVQEAVALGAKLVVGGRREGAQLWPTVLDHVAPHAPLVADETFGPIAPVVRIGSAQEAVALINASRYGLQAGVFTDSLATAQMMFDAVEVGTVIVNGGPQFDSPNIPFGGAKASGVGREGWRYSIAEMTEFKTLVL